MSSNEEIRQSLLNLNPNTRYSMRVRSVDGFGNKSEWSEAMEFEAISAGITPAVPMNVLYEWVGRDLHVSWDSVTSNEDGSTALDIVNYQFGVAIGGTGPDELVYKNRSTVETGYIYTFDMNETDFTEAVDTLYFTVAAVNRSGVRSQAGYTVATVYQAVHPVPVTPDPPGVYDTGSDILVQMDKGENCFARFQLHVSGDGGDTFLATGGEITNAIHVYHPPSDGTYFFKYRIVDIFGKVSAFSDEAYAGVVSYAPVLEQTINTYSSNHTVDLDDNYCLLKCTAALTITLPANATTAFPIGSRVDVLRYGAGAVDIVGAFGVTVVTATSDDLRAQYSTGSATKIGTNEWLLVGDFT
jgi:hypothetical protein